MKYKILFSAVVLLVLTATSCSLPSFSGSNSGASSIKQQPTDFPFPTEGYEITDTPEGLLKFYDFSSTEIDLPLGGYMVDEIVIGNIDILNSQYRVLVTEPDAVLCSYPDMMLANVAVEADITKIGGASTGGWGLFCRFTDYEHMYLFIILPGGNYSISKVQGEELIPLGAPEPQFSPIINQGSTTNHVRIDCVGDILTLEVNGHLVAAVQDNEYTEGYAGLFVGSFDGMGVDVLFDNLAIYQP
jgi:hypothetical protein